MLGGKLNKNSQAQRPCPKFLFGYLQSSPRISLVFEEGASDFNPDGVICLREGWMLLSSHLNSDCHWGVKGGDAQMLISLDTLLGYWVKNIRHITEYSGPQFI